jgi:hypothetical protein
MPLLRSRSLPASLLVGLLLAASPALATASGASTDLYPTDACVARKLAAAADACRASLDAYALDTLRANGATLAKRLDRATNGLDQAFAGADADAAAAGVDCSQTTLSADAMGQKIRDGAAALAATVRGALDLARPQNRVAGFFRLEATALGCAGLVAAEGTHLQQRSTDRDRSLLERDRERALALFRAIFGFFRWPPRSPAPDPSVVQQQLVALAGDVVLGAIVSPGVSSDWTMVTPDAQVPYLGEVLEPICSRGTPWVYFVKRGTVNKLIVYYQGGGACWDYLTCGVLPVFKDKAGASDNPANAHTGFADFGNPANPFRDWNAVFVPYCTGDIHWGDATQTYVDPFGSGNSVTIQHKGRVNAAVAEKWSREHFVDPDEVFVTGSSAGAYGANLNSIYLQEKVYPSSRFAVLGDAGNGVITQDFLQNDIAKWGVDKTLPSWIPELSQPLSSLDPSQLWSAPARFYPANRFATYTTAYDGGNGGQTGFYQIMRNPTNLSAWLTWWNSTCAWHDAMRQQTLAAAASAPNYRYYIGTGSRHTMWGSDKVYTDTTGGVPLLVDWVTAMRDGTPAWTDVECQDCGVLLPGDPKPSPLQPPFVDDGANGRIECSATP